MRAGNNSGGGHPSKWRVEDGKNWILFCWASERQADLLSNSNYGATMQQLPPGSHNIKNDYNSDYYSCNNALAYILEHDEARKHLI